MLTLVVTSGPLEGQRIEIGQQLTVGREGADLELEDDDEVSRRHACLRPVAEGLEVEDLESRNGTRVNGLRITEAVVVRDGALVKVGQTTMRIEVSGGATRVRDADPQATKATAGMADDPAGSKAEAVPTPEPAPAASQPGATEVRAVPTAAARPIPAAAPRPPASAPAPDGQFGTFRASTGKRRRGVASRLWVPAAMTYAAIGGTAAALIVYFA